MELKDLEQIKKAIEEQEKTPMTQPAKIHAEGKDKEPDNDEDDEEEVEKAFTKVSAKFKDDEETDDEDKERYLVKKCSFSKATAKKAIAKFKSTGAMIKKSIENDLFTENEEEIVDVTEDYINMKKSFESLLAENAELKASTEAFVGRIEKLEKGFTNVKSNMLKHLDYSIELESKLSKPVSKAVVVTPIEKSFEQPNKVNAKDAELPDYYEVKKAFKSLAFTADNQVKDQEAADLFTPFSMGTVSAISPIVSQVEKAMGKKIDINHLQKTF